MLYMVVTLDTSHLAISPLNLFAPEALSALNNSLMSVTAETSQDPIGPCGPLEQSVGDRFRHSAMTKLMSVNVSERVECEWKRGSEREWEREC